MTSSPAHRRLCRQFRARHAEFLDARLDAVAVRVLDAHRSQCPRCGAFDVQVRRALLTVSSLPSIGVSPDFAQRLAQRLAAERPPMDEAVLRFAPPSAPSPDRSGTLPSRAHRARAAH